MFEENETHWDEHIVFVEPGGSLMNESFSPKDILKGLLCVPFGGETSLLEA